MSRRGKLLPMRLSLKAESGLRHLGTIGASPIRCQMHRMQASHKKGAKVETEEGAVRLAHLSAHRHRCTCCRPRAVRSLPLNSSVMVSL